MAHTTSLMSLFALLCVASQVQQSVGWGRDFQFNDQWFRNQFNNWNWHWGNSRGNLNEQQCLQLLKDCMAKGDLGMRLQARVVGRVTLEPIQDLINNFDLNRDNCITEKEFIQMKTTRGFSVQYARYQFNARIRSGIGINNVACPGGISVLSLIGLPKPGVVNAVTINNNMIQALVQYCDMDVRRYQTNCDCIQLPSTCAKAPFQTTPACINFRARYANHNYCPFNSLNTNTAASDIATAKAFCAAGRFGDPRTAPLVRILCNLLNQKTPTVG